MADTDTSVNPNDTPEKTAAYSNATANLNDAATDNDTPEKMAAYEKSTASLNDAASNPGATVTPPTAIAGATPATLSAATAVPAQPKGASQSDGSSSEADFSDFKQDNSQHREVKGAGILHDVAESLAGGPRYTYSVDENGKSVRTKVPMTRGQLILGMVSSALNLGGNLMMTAGAGENAGQMGNQLIQQDRARKLAADKKQQDDAQQSWKDQEEHKIHVAQNAEIVSRTALNQAQLSKFGDEAADKNVETYAPMVAKAELTPGNVAGHNVTEAEYKAGCGKGGKYEGLKVGVPDGVAWENGKKVNTFIVVHDANKKYELNEDDRKVLAPYYPEILNAPENAKLTWGSLSTMYANVTAFNLAQQEADTLTARLNTGSAADKEMAASVPNIAKLIASDPAMKQALLDAQKYQTPHGQTFDPWEAAQIMTAPTKGELDPKTGKMKAVPNHDQAAGARFVQAMGGQPVLDRFHEMSPAIQGQQEAVNNIWEEGHPTSTAAAAGANVTAVGDAGTVIDDVAHRYEIPEQAPLMRAIKFAESGKRTKVGSGSSDANGYHGGAAGIFQIMPGTLAGLQHEHPEYTVVDPKNPTDEESAIGAAYYIKDLQEHLGIGSDPAKTALAYRVGEPAYKAAGGDVTKLTAPKNYNDASGKPISDAAFRKDVTGYVSKVMGSLGASTGTDATSATATATGTSATAAGTSTNWAKDKSGLDVSDWDFIVKSGGIEEFIPNAITGRSSMQDKAATDQANGKGNIDGERVATVTSALTHAAGIDLQEYAQKRSAVGKQLGAAAAAKGKYSQDDIDNIVDGFLAGHVDPNMSGFDRTMKVKLTAELAKKGVNIRALQLQFAYDKHLMLTMSNQQQTKMVENINQLELQIEYADSLYQNWHKVSSDKGFKLFNKASLIVASNSSDKELAAAATPLLAHIAGMHDSLAGILSGGYAPTVPAFALADKMIQGDWNEAAWTAGLQNLRTDAKIRKASLNAAYNAVLPGGMQNMAHSEQNTQVAQSTQVAQANQPSPNAPPAAMLKEGVSTTFKNGGGTWTLKNGVPQEVKTQQ